MSEGLPSTGSADIGARLRALAALSPEAAWVVTGQILTAVGALVGVRLLTTLLAPSEYGRLALALALAAVAQQVVFGPLAAAILRFYASAREAGELPAYGSAARRLLHTRALALMAAGIPLIAAASAAHSGPLDGVLLLAALAFATVTGYGSAADAVQSAARRRALVALLQGTGQLLRAGTAASICWLTGAGSRGALLGYVVASALVLFVQWLFLRAQGEGLADGMEPAGPAGDAPWPARLREYAAPFMLWGSFTWAQGASDRWALQAFASTTSVGLYAVLFQLGYYPVSMAAGSLVQLLSPILFDRAGDASDPRRMKSVNDTSGRLVAIVLGLAAATALMSAMAHRRLFELLVAEEYRHASYLLPPMVLAGGLFAAGQVAALPLLSEQRTQPLLAPKVLTAIAGIVLNALGAWWFGVPGVVGAGAVFSSAYLAWVLILVRRRSTAETPAEREET